MTNSLFITGSGGFIGRRFLERLESSKYETAYCLELDLHRLDWLPSGNGKFHPIQADLLDVQKYSAQLEECDTIVHFAAATGKKVSRQAYFNVNALGTKVLVDEAQRLGVRRILHLSSIAVKYPDKLHYYYAQSKEESEKAVTSSGLSYTILRPTIVIGENGPVWNSLTKLARLPVIPLFGGGKAKIQPIYLDDLVDLLLEILDGNNFNNQVIELGGPEVITFETFLSEIHHSIFNKSGRKLRLPYRLSKQGLAILERPFSGILPINAGQLSAFGNDGVIADNDLVERNAPRMKSVKEMITLVVNREKEKQKTDHLMHECKIYSRYLINQEPSTYIQREYLKAHHCDTALSLNSTNRFDEFLVRFSTRGTFAARMADAYANLFYKNALLRRKIILMLAILECVAPYAAVFDVPESSSPVKIIFRLGWRALLFVFALTLAMVVLIPAQIYQSRASNNHVGGN
jgi:nucleoside-diphosphate-sugar epimerase